MAKKKKVKAKGKSKSKPVTKKPLVVPRKTGIGALARDCILKGYTFSKTYATVKKNFPSTEFSKKCFYWYRSHLRTDAGKIVPAATIA